MTIVEKPYKVIWYSMLIVLVLSIIGGHSTMDIHLHNRYFVISPTHIGILFSLILGVIGLIYWLMRHRKLVIWMSVVHIVSTISTFVLFLIASLIFNGVNDGDINTYRMGNQLLLSIMLISILSQLIFMTNLVLSVIKKK